MYRDFETVGWCGHCTARCGKKVPNSPVPIWSSLCCQMPNGSGCVRMPEVGKPNSSMLTGKTAICRNWRVCQRSLPNNPILLLPRRRRPPIRRHASRRDISASHLPIEIKWEQCNRREKPPIVHSQDQSNWRQLVGWNRKSKKCNAQRAVR